MSAILSGWSATKNHIETALPVDNAMLHVGIGFVIYWTLTKVLSQRGAALFAWGGAFLAAVLNEIMDLLVERWPDPVQQYSEGLDDIFWTLALPTVALWLSREPPQPQIIGSPPPERRN